MQPESETAKCAEIKPIEFHLVLDRSDHLLWK